MAKLNLGLDLDNYPEVIDLYNVKQENLDDGGHKAYGGIAVAKMDSADFRELLNVTQDVAVVNMNTKKIYKDALIFIDEDTLEISYCIPKRHRRPGRHEPF